MISFSWGVSPYKDLLRSLLCGLCGPFFSENFAVDVFDVDSDPFGGKAAKQYASPTDGGLRSDYILLVGGESSWITEVAFSGTDAGLKDTEEDEFNSRVSFD